MPTYRGLVQYVQNEERDVAYAPVGAYVANTPLEIYTDFWGICIQDLAAGQTGQFRISGIYACKKASAATVHAFGDKLKYNGTAFVADVTGTWVCSEDSAAGENYVLAWINGEQAGGVSGSPTILDSMAADKFVGRATGTGAAEVLTMTAAGRALVDDATAAAMRETLGSVPFKVATVAALSALTAAQVSDGQAIELRSYTTAGDGGGQSLYYSASSAATVNGGTVFNGPSGVGRYLSTDLSVTATKFGADPSGVADSTAAIQAAIDSFASGNGKVRLTKGVYKVTSTITINKDRIYLVGDGEWATQITFAPTATDILFFVGKGGEGTTDAGVLYQGCISDLSITSADTTFKKTAIEVKDVGEFRVENVVVGPSGSWTGASSVGIRSRGREVFVVRGVGIFADYPIRLAINTSSPTLCTDHFHFEDCYLIASTTGNCVTVEDGTILSHLTFDGQQAWVGGTYGLYWNTTTGSDVSINVLFENVRTEQHAIDTGYQFYVNPNGGVQQLMFRNCYGGTGINGYYLRKSTHVSFENCSYVSTTQLALDLGADCNYTDIRNCFWQSGSTATIDASQILYNAKKLETASPLPVNGFYQAGGQKGVITGGPTYGYDSGNVANDAIITLPIVDGSIGTFFIVDTEGAIAQFGVLPSSTAFAIYTYGTLFTNILNNAGTTNIYRDAGSSTYKLQNKRGGVRRYFMQFLGSSNL